MNHSETLVLGIGNTLLSDEGVGIHALHALESEYSNIPNVTFLDGGTLSFSLATWIEDCQNFIVFDAAELQQPPGAVQVFINEAMDQFLGATKRSAHEVGLMDLMDIARLTEHLPVNRALIGIQPEYMGWGMVPTTEVKNALDSAVAEAVALIKEWQSVETVKDEESLVAVVNE